MLWIDAVLFFLLSLIAHLVVAVPVVIIGYKWGKKQGERSYLAARNEIKEYVRTELIQDVKSGIEAEIRNAINGIIGPVAKAGTAEARSIAAQYASENPGILQLLTGIATRAGLGWGLKQLGAPKEVRDAFKITGPIGISAPSTRRSPELEPVRIPGQ